MKNNNFKEIQKSIIKRFGINCRAVININIYPLQNENGISIKVEQFDIYEDGVSRKIKDIFIHTDGNLDSLIKSINNFKEVK